MHIMKLIAACIALAAGFYFAYQGQEPITCQLGDHQCETMR